VLFPHFQIPIKPHNLANVRYSEIKLDSAFNRFAVINRREEGIEEVSIMTVVFGGKEMAFSIIWRAARCSLCRDMEDRTLEVRRLE